MQDLQSRAQALIERYNARTKHIKGTLKSLSQRAYFEGMNDCLRMVQEAALEETQEQQIREISAPLGVQPSHSATEDISSLQAGREAGSESVAK